MKNLKKILFIFVIVFSLCVFSPFADAKKQAVFPDATKLQPIPTFVHPNVSGNVNSQVNPSFQNQSGNYSSSSNTNASSLDEGPAQNIPSSDIGFFWPTLFIIALIILVIWIIFTFRKASK